MANNDAEEAYVEYITVPKYTCRRCGHQWIPDSALKDPCRIPVVCSKCNSPYWMRQRTREKKPCLEKNLDQTIGA